MDANGEQREMALGGFNTEGHEGMLLWGALIGVAGRLGDLAMECTQWVMLLGMPG